MTAAGVLTLEGVENEFFKSELEISHLSLMTSAKQSVEACITDNGGLDIMSKVGVSC